MEKTTIKDLLKGYKINDTGIQNMANMIVIPLISDTEYTPIANFLDVRLAQDRMYNELEFENRSDDIGILLHGYTIMSDQKAQDRTVPYPHLVKGKSHARVPANCIEPGQGGLLNTNSIKPEDFKILPPSLRALSLQKSTFKSGETSALWDSLDSWTKGIDLRAKGLVSFYTKFKQQLDEFVASFEPVEKQLGSIVIVNSEVVAFDIVPKYESWLQIFRPLIRDSYGAEAYRLIQNKQIESLIDILTDKNIDSVSDLNKAFDSNTEKFLDRIKDIVNRNIELEVSYSALQQMNDLHLVKFESPTLIGCGVFHGDHIVYLSLVNRDIMKKKEKITDFKKTEIYSNNQFNI